MKSRTAARETPMEREVGSTGTEWHQNAMTRLYGIQFEYFREIFDHPKFNSDESKDDYHYSALHDM